MVKGGNRQSLCMFHAQTGSGSHKNFVISAGKVARFSLLGVPQHWRLLLSHCTLLIVVHQMPALLWCCEEKAFPYEVKTQSQNPCVFCFMFNASCSQKHVMESWPPRIWLPLCLQQFSFPALLFCAEAESSGVMLIESVWSIQINLVRRRNSGLPGK